MQKSGVQHAPYNIRRASCILHRGAELIYHRKRAACNGSRCISHIVHHATHSTPCNMHHTTHKSRLTPHAPCVQHACKKHHSQASAQAVGALSDLPLSCVGHDPHHGDVARSIVLDVDDDLSIDHQQEQEPSGGRQRSATAVKREVNRQETFRQAARTTATECVVTSVIPFPSVQPRRFGLIVGSIGYHTLAPV